MTMQTQTAHNANLDHERTVIIPILPLNELASACRSCIFSRLLAANSRYDRRTTFAIVDDNICLKADDPLDLERELADANAELVKLIQECCA